MTAAPMTTPSRVTGPSRCARAAGSSSVTQIVSMMPATPASTVLSTTG